MPTEAGVLRSVWFGLSDLPFRNGVAMQIAEPSFKTFTATSAGLVCAVEFPGFEKNN
jgi:hypothetical protein